jgi:hypothetical protein
VWSQQFHTPKGLHYPYTINNNFTKSEPLYQYTKHSCPFQAQQATMKCTITGEQANMKGPLDHFIQCIKLIDSCVQHKSKIEDHS